MNTDDILGAEQPSSIRDVLDALLIRDELTLANLCVSAEDCILETSIRVLLSNVSRLASTDHLSFNSAGDHSFFLLGDFKYRLSFTEAIVANHLIISIADFRRAAGEPPVVAGPLEFDEGGRYSSISMCMSEGVAELLRSNALTLLEEVRQVFIDGYRWLEETAKLLLKAVLLDTGDELYRAFRIRFPKSVWENIILYVFINGEKGMYIIDPTARDLMMTRFKRRALAVDLSPIEQQISLETELLPKELRYSWESAQQATIIQNTHTHVKYNVNDFPAFFIAEVNSLDFVDDRFAIIPLIFSERWTALVAVCPTSIEPIVAPHRDEIARDCKMIFEKRASALHRAISRINVLTSLHQHGGILEMIAKLIGIVISQVPNT